ncbi:DUF4241 domain-containing protein [Micromonospora sp. NPDC048830]|uniref:DUF4241 domain-containing protein n=1 Tax=Micromonospora sp. NPDC048830 TaxID=3364257 RepID=UPI003720FF57
MWSRRQTLRLALAAAAGGGGTVLGGCSAWSPSGRPDPSRSLSPEESRPWPPPEQAAGLFRPGSRHLLDGGEWATARTLPAGDLHLPSGRLVAADPSWLTTWEMSGIAPFTATVPPGTYPLTLALVEWPQDKRVAAAKLVIRDEPVAAWEMALRPGQDPGTLHEGEAFVVGVNVATIVLFDRVALEAMARRSEENPEFYSVAEAERPVELQDRASGANLIAFHTGWGDGAYPVWVGRTATGAVACFVVDMAMLAPAGSSSS